MQPIPGIQFVDLTILIKKPKILVIGDLHIGYEEYLTSKGVLIPKFHMKELEDKLNAILEKTKPKLIIINGDIKHEFGKISDEEWRNTLKVIDLLSKHARLILIKGNHDNILGPIARKRNVEVRDYHVSEGIYICHGDKIPTGEEFRKAKTIIIGHEHPAITIDDSIRRETYKCFLLGKYNKQNLIVMPSLNLITEGTNVLNEKLLSPFLKDINNFKVYVVGDKIYDFGKVKDHY